MSNTPVKVLLFCRYEWTDSVGAVQQQPVLTVPELAGLDQGSPALIEAVQLLFLSPPPLGPAQHLQNFALEGDGQGSMLDQTYFHERKKGGFFVGKSLPWLTPLSVSVSPEAGAYDGWTGSNSLHFEAVHHWSGLLVEPVPYKYAEIAGTGRRVWSSHTSLATTPTAKVLPVSIEKRV